MADGLMGAMHHALAMGTTQHDRVKGMCQSWRPAVAATAGIRLLHTQTQAVLPGGVEADWQDMFCRPTGPREVDTDGVSIHLHLHRAYRVVGQRVDFQIVAPRIG